jgi:hypothetical protein
MYLPRENTNSLNPSRALTVFPSYRELQRATCIAPHPGEFILPLCKILIILSQIGGRDLIGIRRASLHAGPQYYARILARPYYSRP